MDAQAFSAFSLNKFEEALEVAQRILAEDPDAFDVLNVAGISAANLGNYPLAETFWKRALALKPDDVQSLGNLGVLYISLRRFTNAEIHLRRALSLEGGNVDIRHKLGHLFEESGRDNDAVREFTEALRLEPQNKNVMLRLAHLYSRVQNIREADRYFLQLLDLDPAYTAAHFHYAIFQFKLGHYEIAEQHLKDVIVAKPDDGDAYANLGITLKAMRRYEEAEEVYKKAISLNPNDPQRHGNLGVMYVSIGRYDEAEACYRTAIDLKPDYVDVIFNLGYVHLLKTEFDEGLKAFELRYDLRMSKLLSKAPVLPYPQWNGQDLSGKSIVVWHEQDLGDVIQFARFTRSLKAQGVAVVTFICERALHSLLKTLGAIDNLYDPTEAAQMALHDYWILMASIPFQLKMRADTIPSYPSYLSAMPERIDMWEPRVRSGKFKVGLLRRYVSTVAAFEEPSLQTFEALWKVKGITFYDLQKHEGKDGNLAPSHKHDLVSVGSEISDFGDMAAIISNLDLVISVDSDIIHVAGAMGKPAWVLLPLVSKWQWQRDRTDSPWYPSVRLFRQKRIGSWDEPMKHLVSALQKSVTASKKSTKR